MEIPVYAIPGNHDSGSAMSLWHQPFFKDIQGLAPNFHLLLENRPCELESAWLLPCPLMQRVETGDPTQWLRNPELYSELNNQKPRIVIGHGSVYGFGSTYSDEEGERSATNLIQINRLPRDQIDYVALGDWHGTLQIQPWAWYSGTPEFDRFKKGSDHDPGNVLLVDLPNRRNPGLAPTIEKIPTGIIGWHTLEFIFASDHSLEDLKREIDKLIGNRAMVDLLQLTVDGTVSLEHYKQWKLWVEILKTRLIRLRLNDQLRAIPSDEELNAVQTLTQRPLTGKVFEKLLAECELKGEQGEIARRAMRELYGFATC
jgi:DNA repair exonuclease SbcCD nuclease subunit